MATNNPNTHLKSFWLALIPTLGAVATHAYLMNHHYQVKFGFEMQSSLCDVNEKLSCAVASASPFSELFGVPVAVLGMLINGLLAMVLIASRWPLFGASTQALLPGMAKLLSLGIFAVSIAMAGISFFILKSICPFCTLAYILSLFTLIGTWAFLGGSIGIDMKAVTGTFVAALMSFALGFAVHKSNLIQYGGKKLSGFVAAQVIDWKNQAGQDIDTVEPMILNRQEGAVMRLVEFADYLCPHCKHASPKLHLFLQSRPDVSLEFQAFPLDGQCNGDLPKGDGARCLLSRFAYCGQQQGKGWEAQKWIFDHQENLISISTAKEKLTQAVAELGLNDEEIKSCLESENAYKAIQAQAALGEKLGVQGTPALFVNGRKIQMISLPVLQELYQEIKRAK